jgi:hypothetical protein
VAHDDRRIEEAGPEPGRAPRAAAAPVVQLGAPGRTPFVLAGLTAAFVLVAIVKPWPAPAGPSVELVRASPTPTATPSGDPLAVVHRECQEPPGWRTYTQERWSEGTLHAWTTVSPAQGHHAPIEDGLPTVPYATEVLELGFCTPYTSAEERPPDGAAVHVWRVDIVPGAGGGTPRAELLDVTPAVTGLDLPYGGLFRPPSGEAAIRPDRWPPARYVFEVVGPGAGYDRWWAISIDPPLHPLAPASPSPNSEPVP